MTVCASCGASGQPLVSFAVKIGSNKTVIRKRVCGGGLTKDEQFARVVACNKRRAKSEEEGK